MRHIATQKGAEAILLFIAELNGFKQGTVSDKVAFGETCYFSGTLHELDYSKESDRSDAHENIWLNRLYDELDNYYQLGLTINLRKKQALEGNKDAVFGNPSTTYQWTVPLELDASASMLQMIGVLLNDERLCDMTNVIGNELHDPWNFEGIPRTQFKHAATPMLYGSSRACHELWQDKKHDYTIDQVKLFNTELASGALGLANQFKEFIISNVKPKEQMTVKINGEEFTIECNRFRNVGEKTARYDIYDSITKSIRRVAHTTTRRVADLDQFRRYFVTLLIHNLDSQVADKVMQKVMEKYGWGKDIHDAFIVNPESAEDVRRWYSEELTAIYNNRQTILSEYFQSIGIGGEAQTQWSRVKAMVQPIKEFTANRMALK